MTRLVPDLNAFMSLYRGLITDMTQNGGSTKRDEDAIDANLRRVYDDILNQEVPDRFRSLLDQLRAQDNNPKDGGTKS